MHPASLTRASRWLIAALPLFAFACEESTSRTDGGVRFEGGTLTCPGGVDPSVGYETAHALAAGEDAQGFICPMKDQDFFKIEVPQGAKLLRVKLQHSVTVSNVNLSYLVIRLEGETEEVVGRNPLWTGSGIMSFDDYHCVEPGTYYIVVSDDGDDGKDGSNPYTLSYSTEQDSDTGEPQNNDPATAPAPGSGTIACNGDVDYYTVSVGTDQLLEVTLTADQSSTVDLRYTIYDEAMEAVVTDDNTDGSVGPTNLSTIHAMPKAGTYTIAVTDIDDDDSDPQLTYTLTVGTRPEEDPGDQGTRNDHPTTATELSYSACQPPNGCTRQGQIGSKADVDYYKITGLPAGISEDNPAVMEVVVSYGGASVVDPQVGFIYPHAGTECTKDTCCQVINETCTNFLDCRRETYSCIPKESIYCGDVDCVPDPSPACATQKACAGAVVCLPEGRCGAEQVVRNDDNGEEGGAQVRTAHPLLHPGPWYIRVNDMSNNDYEHGKTYSITVKVRMDPDGNQELNSEYFPVLVSSAIGTTDYHVNAAKDKGLKFLESSASETEVVYGPFSGHISYEGDQDWYLFDHPCPGEDCVLRIEYNVSGNCPSDLQFVYTFHKRGGDGWFSFPGSPSSGASGHFGYPNQCLYAFDRHGGNPYTYLISVADDGHDSWGWDCRYTLTIKKRLPHGCTSPCYYNTYGDGSTQCDNKPN